MAQRSGHQPAAHRTGPGAPIREREEEHGELTKTSARLWPGGLGETARAPVAPECVIVYDTGALVAAEGGNGGCFIARRGAARPPQALWRSGSGVARWPARKTCPVCSLAVPSCRSMSSLPEPRGTLCGKAGTTDIVDSPVVVLARFVASTLKRGPRSDGATAALAPCSRVRLAWVRSRGACQRR